MLVSKDDCKCGHMPADHAWFGKDRCEECECDYFTPKPRTNPLRLVLIGVLGLNLVAGVVLAATFLTAPLWATLLAGVFLGWNLNWLMRVAVALYASHPQGKWVYERIVTNDERRS